MTGGPTIDPTIEEWAASARRRLAAALFAPSPREAWLLLSHVLGRTEAQVLAGSRDAIPPAEQSRLDRLLERRLAGEPMAYLLGRREFYGRELRVDDRVLIPRPETEHLIETVLALPLPSAPRVLDLGTGSGCIALTLALELPAARVVALDRSPAALAVAAENCRRYGASSRVALVAGDLASPLALSGFDLIVSNPPYVAEADAPRISIEVRGFEPALALFGGPDGLAVLHRLLELAGELAPGAWLAAEIGDGQLPAIEERLRALYPAGEVALAEWRPDYAGKPRVVVLKRT